MNRFDQSERPGLVDHGHDMATIIRADYPDPLWVQTADLIQGQISDGSLAAGARLPPERELCQQLGISRVTLRKALNQLVEAGVLNASHGRGWYVAKKPTRREWPNTLESFSETAARMGLEPRSEVLCAEVVPATLDEAEELSIAPGTDLFRLERVRLLDQVPIALDLTKIGLAVVPGIAKADFAAASLYSDSTMEAREADATEARYLRLAEGKPLLVMHQLAFDAADRPLFASTIKYAGERYRLRTSFSRPQAFGRLRG